MPVSIAVVDKFSYIVADYWDLTPKFDSCSQPIDLKEEKRGTTSATFFCIFNKINDLHAQTVELEVPYINRLLP
ncbi:MAG: hypothetical protein A3F78_00820 [Burkholderiales bacterium RIFCSPLOWO2_12_FULL_61_40]|nr:MAG: hypothetical protein A3F78_00820 [Burkholderiales bacterium RIFCSPLOWO2_12_FULL_61_40]